MKLERDSVRLSASDLSNHLGCAHITTLDYLLARRELSAPEWTDPDSIVLRQLGERHEAAYLSYLRSLGLQVAACGESEFDERAASQTLKLMKQGLDVITQAVLRNGRWYGRADVLRRVETSSQLGAWSYEVYDCKLPRETKAATILQLSLYSDLLHLAQGTAPKFMYVVSPRAIVEPERFPVAEYAAYYRMVKRQLESAVERIPTLDHTTAEPTSQCEVCRWWKKCDSEWRAADHLSLVAGMSRLHRKQLNEWDIATMAQLASMSVPLTRTPEYGSKEGYFRVREQARLQVTGREQQRPIHECFDIRGLAQLPEPTPGDIFFDLEGDAFVGDGMEYLFGFVQANADGSLVYQSRWCFKADDEKAAFEWFIDQVMQSRERYFDMHVYHFGAYEPTALKRLMGKYATREDEVDRILRGERLVDLHRVLKQSVRASVEEYSLKALEPFHGFARTVPLDEARPARRLIEHCLELGRLEEITPEAHATVEGYNFDDCASTAALRDWLEEKRAIRIQQGQQVPRPQPKEGDPSDSLSERQMEVARLAGELLRDIPADPEARNPEQTAKWLLANLLDWHRRENKAAWWEFYRLKELSDEDLINERDAISGLTFADTQKVRNIANDRYHFERQETTVRKGDEVYFRGDKIGKVLDISLDESWIDIRKTKKTNEIHPSSIYCFAKIDVEKCQRSLLRLAQWVLDHGIGSPGEYQSARDLLLRRHPRFQHPDGLVPLAGEGFAERAKRLAGDIDSSMLAIQGPPGAGKTFTAAHIVCDLVRKGMRVAITGPSHKVIRNLMEDVVTRAQTEQLTGIRALQKVTEKSEKPPTGFVEVEEAKDAIQALQDASANVVGGTVWLWAPETSANVADVVVVDEAGQVSLANVLAAAQCAKSIVLLGDPQQLDQPLKGSHPDGADVSALQHLIGEAKTISSDQGLFLEHTWRMHPKLCQFTSQAFYEDRVQSRSGLEQQTLEGHRYLNGSGHWFVGVEHHSNQNSSPEEVDVVEALVRDLTAPTVTWFNGKPGVGKRVPLTLKDILVIAPYNVQVSNLSERLGPDVRVGTVDKFQGQEAAVVIYSLTTSSQEDAPRGMEFLYSLNRLNVATSRGRAICIVVGSPALLDPHCRAPRQMQLANALCLYAELARYVQVIDERGQIDFVVAPAA